MGGRKPNRVARKFSDSEIHRNEKIFYKICYMSCNFLRMQTWDLIGTFDQPLLRLLLPLIIASTG